MEYLITTDYLTDASSHGSRRHQLRISNREVRQIFEKQIRSWFTNLTRGDMEKLRAFSEAVRNGNAEEMERRFNEYLGISISIRDTGVRKDKKENLPCGKATTKGSEGQNPSGCFYHGILLGLLIGEEKWVLRSNAESRIGYRGILVKIPNEKIGS